MPIISTLALYIGELYCFPLARDFIDAHFCPLLHRYFYQFSTELPRQRREEGESERGRNGRCPIFRKINRSPIGQLYCFTSLTRICDAVLPEQKAETDTRLLSVSIVYLESCPANWRHQFRVNGEVPCLPRFTYTFRNELSITLSIRFQSKRDLKSRFTIVTRNHLRIVVRGYRVIIESISAMIFFLDIANLLGRK